MRVGHEAAVQGSVPATTGFHGTHHRNILSRFVDLNPFYVSQSRVMGKAKIERPCPFCGEKFGARELREHIPHCPKGTIKLKESQ